jgi:hypothetical protein
VDDVGSQGTEDPEQLRDGEQVVTRRHRTRRVVERDVPDAPLFELVNEGPGRRDSDDLHALGGEGL